MKDFGTYMKLDSLKPLIGVNDGFEYRVIRPGQEIVTVSRDEYIMATSECHGIDIDEASVDVSEDEGLAKHFGGNRSTFNDWTFEIRRRDGAFQLAPVSNGVNS